MSPPYTFDSLDETTLPELRAFLRTVSGRAVTVEALRAKYAVAYLAWPVTGCVVRHAGRMVAFVGTVPCRLTDGRDVRLAVQLVDVSTAPDHQRRGLYMQAQRHLLSILAARGVTFCFGMPNDASATILRDPAWSEVNRLVRYSIPAGGGVTRLARRLIVGGAARGFAPHRVPGWPQSSLASPGAWRIDRSEAYYAHKAAVGGSWVADMGGVRVWMKGSGTLSIGDMDPPPDDAVFDRTLARVLAIGQACGVSRVHFQSTPGTRLDEYFRTRWPPSASWLLTMCALPTGTAPVPLRCTLGDVDIF
ncbi:GNAT family N-acetyltransferase [Luteitalea sp.]